MAFQALAQIRIRPSELAEINRAMRELPNNVRRKVVRGAMRSWTRDTIRLVKSQLPKRSGRLRRSIAAKIKSNRRGVWAAVGGKTTTKEKLGIHKSAKLKQQLGWDYLGAGWRLHFIEGGFHPGGGRTLVAGQGTVARVANGRRLIFVDMVRRDLDRAIREMQT